MFFPYLNSATLSRWVFLLFFVLLDVHAESVIGTVSFSTGDVKIETNGESRVARVGGMLHEQDKILTGSDGYVILKMIDGGKYTLRPDSELTFEEYRQHSEESVILSLLKGGVKSDHWPDLEKPAGIFPAQNSRRQYWCPRDRVYFQTLWRGLSKRRI
ncbi:MAG: hypothetical protein GKR95_13035 [Gammaproteobacteria bacterium]|nr:hypothetical protein [Gammaproteobacteria bacterium]